MDAAEKTRLEMEAGARQLAKANGEALPSGYMAALIRTHERNAQLKAWERAGKVTIEHTRRYTVGNVRYKRGDSPDDPPPEQWHTMVHVLPAQGGPSFTDIEAEQMGAYPSEVLIANIALYLQSVGEL